MAALRITFSDAKTDNLDGLTMEYPAWWFNLRPSNTEPLVRLNLEADTKDRMDTMMAEVMQVIREADPSMVIEAG